MEYIDGSVQWMNTEQSGSEASPSILHSEIYDGESQDCASTGSRGGMRIISIIRVENAIAIDPRPVRIEAQDFPSIRVEQH